MGFSNENKGGKILASMKTIKDADDKSNPFFIIKEKKEGAWVEKERFKTFSATPYDIELGSYDYKGSPVDTVIMQLMDGIDKVQLEFNLDSGLSRSLLNTLLGESHIGEFNMSLYVNKAGYPSIGIENDGQKTSWKYKFEEFPAMEKNKKGVVIDNEQYLIFMRDMVREIKVKLQKQNGTTEAKAVAPEPATNYSANSGQENDSLPF